MNHSSLDPKDDLNLESHHRHRLNQVITLLTDEYFMTDHLSQYLDVNYAQQCVTYLTI